MLSPFKLGLLLSLGGVVVLTVVAVMLLHPGIGVVGQQPDTVPTDAYDFPIKPGTSGWANLTSHEEMLRACQVPESVLREMSTAGLIETCLNYPLLGDMMAYSSPQQGFDAVVSRFNGLQALLRREDVGTQLLARYRRMAPEAIEENWTSLQVGEYAASFLYIETILAQDTVLSNLTQAERQELLAECMAKIRSKQELAYVYGHFGQERTALVMGRILQKENLDVFNQKVQEDVALRAFLQDGASASEEVLNKILLQTERLLSR